jgi:uncharacterized protein YecT (DUF1311 family)
MRRVAAALPAATIAAILAATLAAGPATAQDRPPEAGGCDRGELTGGRLAQCLIAAERRSSDALDAAFKAAVGSIATRAGVYDTQRARWRNSLTESQDLWLHLRNTECQDVAPFEGQAAAANGLRGRASIFEAKTMCSIRMNEARTADIQARYPSP